MSDFNKLTSAGKVTTFMQRREGHTVRSLSTTTYPNTASPTRRHSKCWGV